MDEEVRGVHICVVGAGVMGLQCAVMLSLRGALVTVIDRQAEVGGCWRSFANSGSRVQSLEAAYRIDPAHQQNNFATRDNILSALEQSASHIHKIVYSATVLRVSNTGTAACVRYCYPDGSHQVSNFAACIFCCGGLQKPRQLQLPQSDTFQGPIVEGLSGLPDQLDVEGKAVVIIGMGAFAVENARECIFRGATTVTLLARHKTFIIPKLLLYAGFAVEQDYKRMRMGSRIGSKRAAALSMKSVGSLLTRAYDQTGAADALPPAFAALLKGGEGSVQQALLGAGATIPTSSDAFYIGYALGKLRVVEGEVARCLADGVQLKDGK